MTRRQYAPPIRLEELEAVREQLGLAKGYVTDLLSRNNDYPAMPSTMRTKLQRIQGHLARAQDELKTLQDRTTSKS